MKTYWVSAIVLNKDNKNPWLLAMNNCQSSLEKAMEEVAHIKNNFTVLSTWVDEFDKNNVKQTVFHKCYIDAFGNISK